MSEPVGFRLAEQEYDPAILLDTITEHPDNANQGAEDAIGESLDELGFYGAILVHAQTRRILAGNTRYRVARAAGATTLPAFLVSFEDEEQARKMLAGDNRTNRLGADDQAKLLALLQPLPDLRGTGFTSGDLAALVSKLNPEPPDDFPEYGDDIETKYECPACHYRWSGKTGGEPDADQETALPGAVDG